LQAQINIPFFYQLPEEVKLNHYEAVVALEEGQGLRSAFTLTKEHLKPMNYQNMNVCMAMQVRNLNY
jgi:hypothetical protein